MSIVDVERSQSAKYKLKVIDCDIHPAMTSWKEVHPYLEKRWIEHLTVYGSHLRHAFSEALSHPRMSPDAAREMMPTPSRTPAREHSIPRSRTWM